MQWTQVIVSSVVTAALILGAGYAFSHWGWRGAAWAHSGEAPYGSAHGHGGRRHGWLCDDRSAERMDDVLALVEARLDLTTDQAGGWSELAARLRAGSVVFEQACKDWTDGGPQRTAPDALAQSEDLLTAGLTALQEVRPAFDTVYASLTERQRDILDRLFAERRHR